MSETVRYGLIGCGMMGQEHLRNIALLPGATVTRIFEPNQGMADASLALARGAQRAGSLAEVVQAADVDAVGTLLYVPAVHTVQADAPVVREL